MSKIFYDHLIMIDDLFIEVDILIMEDHEKANVRRLIDEIAHQKIITRILELLPQTDHEEFLTRLYNAPQDVRHLTYLCERVSQDITYEIALIGEELKKEFHKMLAVYHKKGKKVHGRS